MLQPDLSAFGSPHSELHRLRFHVERFEYVCSELLLRLSVRVSRDLAGTDAPMLVVERETVARIYRPLISCTPRAVAGDAGGWLWRGAFAVPPETACDPASLFALRFHDSVLSALPTPRQRVFGIEGVSPAARRQRAWPQTLRSGALLFVAASQLGALPGGSVARALADAGPSPGSAPAAETPTVETPTAETQTVQATATTQTVAPPAAAPAAAPATGRVTAEATTRPVAASPAPVARKSPPPAAPTVAGQRPQRPSSVGGSGATITASSRRQRGSEAATPASGGPTANVALPPGVLAAQAGALAAELSGSPAAIQALDFYRIPLFLLPVYQAAAAEYGVPWQILAAINEVETNYGRDLSVSSAGAVGWMQFMPATWLQYGVDASDAGYADPYNPIDAIFAAARYLRAAGAHTNLSVAILAYNHSDAYLRSVLLRAQLISALPERTIAALTSLADAGEPVSGTQISWGTPRPRGSASSATARARPAAAIHASAARAGVSTAPPPGTVAASAGLTAARPPQLADVRSAPTAAVVAVQDGRVVRIGSSTKLGRFIVLRGARGDVFTYAGLGRTATSYVRHPIAAHTSGATGVGHRLPRHAGRVDSTAATAPASTSHGPQRRERLPLRVGALVAQGTVLGYLHVPRGARDGHMLFAIQPADDRGTIDPRPILSSWRQLDRSLHPEHARSRLIEEILATAATRTVGGAAAGAAHAARSRGIFEGPLDATQWEHLIARIASLPAPTVATKPSSSAIPDH